MTEHATSSTSRQIVLEVSRDALTNGIQVSINDLDENGHGFGYRIAGPKFSGKGTVLVSHVLSPGNANEISHYLSKVKALVK